MVEKESKQVGRLGEAPELDEAVISRLPLGSKVLSVTFPGGSLWVATAKIVVRLRDGTTAEFFKKGASGPNGVHMMQGTFEAEQALHSFVPDLVPEPIACGTHAGDSDTSFYLCEYVDMHDKLPSPQEWASAVSRLHLASMGKSPEGRYGFHATTHLASVPVNNEWNHSWEAFWKQQMTGLFDQDDTVNGHDGELAPLKATFLEQVIPRFLRPLETEGRSVQACLIHSDLWPGNIKPRASSDRLCMFDACAYWGHNEADLGVCRNPRYKLGKPCIRDYLNRVSVSEPRADFDGRNAVYAMKYHVLLSVMYPDKKRFRHILRDELKSAAALMEASSTNVGKLTTRL